MINKPLLINVLTLLITVPTFSSEVYFNWLDPLLYETHVILNIIKGRGHGKRLTCWQSSNECLKWNNLKQLDPNIQQKTKSHPPCRGLWLSIKVSDVTCFLINHERKQKWKLLMSYKSECPEPRAQRKGLKEKHLSSFFLLGKFSSCYYNLKCKCYFSVVQWLLDCFVYDDDPCQRVSGCLNKEKVWTLLRSHCWLQTEPEKEKTKCCL